MRKDGAILAFFISLFTFSIGHTEKIRLGDLPEKNEKESSKSRDERSDEKTPPKEPKRAKPAPSKPKPVAIKSTRVTFIPVPAPAEKKPKPVTPQPTPPGAPAANRKGLKEKSAALYLEALNASQLGKTSRARELCAAALKLDPENLQASRMLERLDARLNKP